MGAYFRLISYLGQAKKETLIRILLGLGIVACGFAQAFFLAQAVTAFIQKDSLSLIMKWLLLDAVALGLRAFLLRLQEVFLKLFAAKLKTIIRDQMLDKLMDLGPAYKNDRRTGNLQSLITDGIESLEPFLTQYLPQTVVVLVVTVFVTWYMWRMDHVVGLIIFAMAVVSVVVPHLFMPAVNEAMVLYWQEYAELNAQYIDSMQGMTTLKALGASKREGKRLEQEAHAFARESLRNLGISISDSSLIMACIVAGTGLSTLVASFHMANGLIGYGALLQILFLSGECLKPMSDLSLYWHSSYMGFSVADELYAILDHPLKRKHDGRVRDLAPERAEVSLCDLSFRYNEDGPLVLNHANMVMEQGKTTALVGKSGSGKSTIVNLLLHFYESMESGELRIGGIPIADYDEAFLRSQIAVVFQDTYLFYGTVRENLLMGRPGASEADMIAAAKAANAHQFIMELPDGYDTIVGERGATLSGGQRQRISIARAILKDAPILVLDEATSSVDTDNEKEIQEAMKRASRGKTTIVIAHRLSTIEEADRIYVLRDGLVAGSGTHKELLSNNEVYQALVQAQELAEHGGEEAAYE